MNRRERARIAQATIEILERGNYRNRSGETIDLTAAIARSKSRSIHYTEDSFERVFAERERLGTTLAHSQPEFTVTNETTLHAARRLSQTVGIEQICCLNFASAMSPGGGFLAGSQAQEESLARATALYPCLVQMPQIYEQNRRLNSPLFTDDMVYSPQVPVFRDDDDLLLNEPFYTSIVTSPAVRANAIVDPGELARMP